MNRKSLLLIAMSFIITISGCKEKTPDIIADSIDLIYQTGPNILPNEIVEIRMKNQTKYCIVFPIDYDIKVFINKNGYWDQVSNLVTYISDRPQILEPKGNIFSESVVVIRPDVSNIIISEPIDSYALITGYFCDDENIVIEKKLPFLITPAE